MDARLYRSRDDRMLAGVAGGLADYWDADPSLVQVPLDALERSVRIHEMRICSSLLMRAIVAGEQNQCMSIYSNVPQLVNQTPDVAIHSCDHGSFTLLRIRPFVR